MIKKSTDRGCQAMESTGGFRPLGSAKPEVLFRARPAGDSRYLEFTSQDGFGCFVRSDAVLAMATWGDAAGRSEVIGRLGGRQCHDGQGTYVVVEQATLSHGAHGSAGYVMADIEAQQLLHDDFCKECRVLDAIGWWHTHPNGLELFYSPDDRENQATWTDRNSIGIVLNPQIEGDGLKVFRGPHSESLKRAFDDHVLVALRAKTATRPLTTPTLASRFKALTPKRKTGPRLRTACTFDLCFGEMVAVSTAVIALLVAMVALGAALSPRLTVVPAPLHVAVDRTTDTGRPGPVQAPAERNADFAVPDTTVAAASEEKMQSESGDNHRESFHGQNQRRQGQDLKSRDDSQPLPTSEEHRLEPSALPGSGSPMPGIQSSVESK